MTLQLGEEISAGGAGTKALMLQVYLPGLRHQWGVETWRNVLQVIERMEEDGTYTVRGNEEVQFDFASLDFYDSTDTLVDQVWKRRVWNNGPPMDPFNELLPYFKAVTLGGGANRFSLANPTGQYGQGTRASILPHSDLLVFTTLPGGQTWVVGLADDGTSFRLIKFTQFTSEGVQLLDLAELDGSTALVYGTDYVPLDPAVFIHPTVLRDGGVTYVLLGRDHYQPYIEGDQYHTKMETARGLVDDLTKRLHSPVPVTVSYLGNYTPSTRVDRRVHAGLTQVITVDGVQKIIDPRPLKTYIDWFHRVPKENRETVVLSDGTEVDVYMLPETWNWKAITKQQAGILKRQAEKDGTTVRIEVDDAGQFWRVVPNQDSWLPYDGKGFVVAQFGHEMMPVHRAKDGTEMSRPDALSRWWVTNSAVAERVAIVLRPPVADGTEAWGVKQNSARSALEGPNGTPLPLDQWQEEFFDLVPEFVKRALNDANRRPPQALDPEVFKRIQEAMKGRLELEQRIENLIDPNGTLEGDEDEETASNPVHTGTNRRHVNPATVKRVKGTVKNTKTPSKIRPVTVQTFMPNYEWLSADEWTARCASEAQGKYCLMDGAQAFCYVEHTPAGTTLWFNEGHAIYTSQHLYYTSTYLSGGRRSRVRRRATMNLQDVVDIVKNVYVELGIADVFWAWHRAGINGGHDHHRFMELVASDLMTQSLGGYVNADSEIKRRIGEL